MNKILLLTISVLMIGIVSASLGTFPVNYNVPIRVTANCSDVNITEVTNNNGTVILNTPMTYLGGQTFIYYFNKTSVADTYSYSWNNPCIDCSYNACGNSFIISAGNMGFYIMLTIIILGILLLGIYIRNIPITLIGSLCSVAWGIYTGLFGWDSFQNIGTQILSIAILAFGFYWGFQAMGEYLELL
jgi:hypothetical protein